MRDIQLLRLGRHFRTADGFIIIVGRDEQDNAALEKLALPADYTLQLTVDYGSPFVLAEAGIPEDGLNLAASLCVRYSAVRLQASVPINIVQNGVSTIVDAAPASEREIEQFRIQPQG
jgi:predicted ribosome quality control (RQC) complex YloA/Tae2 family protein